MLTELFGKNAIDEIEAVDDHVWKRNVKRKIIEYGKDSIEIGQDVYGSTYQDKQGKSLNNKSLTQWAKSPINSLKECIFVNLALTIQCHVIKKYTSTDCFFGHFASG